MPGGNPGIRLWNCVGRGFSCGVNERMGILKGHPMIYALGVKRYTQGVSCNLCPAGVKKYG